jgi:hypothetical protein
MATASQPSDLKPGGEDHAGRMVPVMIELLTGVRRARDGTHAFYQGLGYANEGTTAMLCLRKEFKQAFPS